MSVEITPRGIACNLKCVYCYQDPMRDAGNISKPLDVDAIMRQLDKECGSHGFSVFGGEPLLTPLSVLEKFFAYGLSKWGKNGVQTNGTLITPEHIELFKKYRVHVGFSVDGPEELNGARCGLDLTVASCRSIVSCLSNGVAASLIVTLSTVNAGDDSKLERLVNWMLYLDSLGLSGIRVHLLEVDNPKAAELRIPDEQAIAILTSLWDKESQFRHAKFDKFREIERMLRGDHKDVTCVWNGCDPLNTAAVVNIGPDGTVSNCGRTNKDGVIWLKSDRPSPIRTHLLAHTPFADGGCQGCRFFDACRGYCPGTAIDRDWRNRTAECRVLIGLFEHGEKKLGIVANLPYKEDAQSVNTGHGDAHGDAPHGDSHGDHTDTSRVHQN